HCANREIAARNGHIGHIAGATAKLATTVRDRAIDDVAGICRSSAYRIGERRRIRIRIENRELEGDAGLSRLGWMTSTPSSVVMLNAKPGGGALAIAGSIFAVTVKSGVESRLHSIWMLDTGPVTVPAAPCTGVQILPNGCLVTVIS